MTSQVRFSILIPTIGRPTLYRTLACLLEAGIRKDDQVIVVGDGRRPEAERIASFFKDRLPISYVELSPPGQNAGHPARNYGMSLSTGTHLLSIDDDDGHVKGALDVVRRLVSGAPDRIHIFRMTACARRLPWDVLWRERSVGECNLGTPLFVVPNDRSRLGVWGNRYAGDYDFIRSTVDKYPPEG